MGFLAQTMFDPVRAAVNGVIPDWTQRWGTPGGDLVFDFPTGSNNVGPNVLFYDATPSGVGSFATWDRFNESAHVSADTDSLILFQYLSGPASNDNFWLAARASGGGGTENGYTFRDAQSGTLWEVSEWTAGSETILGSFDPGALSVLTWYWVQLRVIGDQIKARIWEYGTPNPSGWDVEVTDSVYTVAGWIGFGTSWSDDIEVDFFHVATDGDFAQLPRSVVTADPLLTATPLRVPVSGTSFLVFIGESNKSVDWAITAGDGSLNVIDAQTDDQGRAIAVYTPGTVDTLVTVEVTYGT